MLEAGSRGTFINIYDFHDAYLEGAKAHRFQLSSRCAIILSSWEESTHFAR